MKKKILLILILLLSATYVKAADLDTIFKETEFAYFRNSINAQYNSAKNSYYDPAEATTQDMQYSVCSRYTANVYKNAFGITLPANTNKLMKFVDANYNNSNYKKYIIAYHDCVTNEKGKGSCNTMTEANYNKLIGSLKPGDVLVYTSGELSSGSGHALIIYDTFVNSDGKNDAYVLNSTGGGTILTRAQGTNRLFYNYRRNSDSYIQNIDKSIKEGTIKFKRFRADDRFKFNTNTYGFKDNTEYRVAIIRFVVDNKYPVFDTSTFAITEEKTLDVTKSNGYLRTKYSDLSISKTVSAGDNDVVIPGEELTYTLKITNNSSKAYGKFYIEETITDSSYTTITEATGGTISGNKINYEVDSLGAGKTKTFTYKVKVTDDVTKLNKTITSVGKFSNTSDFTLSLTTGTVKNKIDNKLTEEEKTSIINAYNNLKSTKTGLDLINETYKQALDIDLDLNNFKISKLIVQNADTLNNCKTKGTKARNCANAFKLGNYKIGDTNYLYKDMILNNYWSAVINTDASLNDDNIDFDSSKTQIVKDLFTWSGSGDSSKRAKTIIDENFEDGDILIYYNDNDYLLSNSANSKNSNESGLYAYIYINGSFVGVNNSGTKKRNYFTTKYYSDNSSLKWYTLQNESDLPTGALDFINLQTLYGKYYYVILRPALSEGMVAGVTAEITPPEEDPPEDEEGDDEEGEESGDVITEEEPPSDDKDEEPPYTGNFISKVILSITLLIGTITLIISIKNQKLNRI